MSALDFLIFLLTPLSQNVILEKRIAVKEVLSHVRGAPFLSLDPFQKREYAQHLSSRRLGRGFGILQEERT